MADELMVNYNDINYMYDMIQKFPNKKYIVRIRKDDKVNWEELRMFNDKVNLIVALEDMLNAKSNCGIDLKYYFAYPITTWAEVRLLLDLGVSELFIDAPLTFDLEQLSKQVNLPLRMVVNKCYNESLPRKDGMCGSYVRPEDVEIYDRYITTFEFDTNTLSQEETLLDIYKKGVWPGNLNILLTNLNFNVDNRGLPEEFGEIRSTCQQSCQRTGKCHFCENAFKFSRAVDTARKSYSSIGSSPEALEASIDN